MPAGASSVERPTLARDELGECLLGIGTAHDMRCVVALLGKLLLDTLRLLLYQQRLDAHYRGAIVASNCRRQFHGVGAQLLAWDEMVEKTDAVSLLSLDNTGR